MLVSSVFLTVLQAAETEACTSGRRYSSLSGKARRSVSEPPMKGDIPVTGHFSSINIDLLEALQDAAHLIVLITLKYCR